MKKTCIRIRIRSQIRIRIDLKCWIRIKIRNENNTDPKQHTALIDILQNYIGRTAQHNFEIPPPPIFSGHVSRNRI